MSAALTVPSLLAARAAVDGGRVALRLPDGSALRFEEWWQRANAVARGLRERGVRHGDRVGLCFGGADWLDYAVAYAATLTAGAVAVPLSDALPRAQVRDALADCGAVGVVSADDGWTVGSLDTGDPSTVDGQVTPGDLAQIVYTSGTTGRPKGVAASHANLCHGHASQPRRRRFGHSETLLHAFPIGTNGAQTMLMYALTAHPAILAMPAFDSDGFGALIEAHRVGSVFVVPSMAIDLLSTGVPDRHDLSSVLLLSSSAAALPPAVAAALGKALPAATIVNCYTSTEAAPAETMMVVDPARPGSVGRPAEPGDLLVTDGHGAPLPAGQVGEVWLRCPAAPRRYVGDPAATAATFRAGRVRMGDLGYLDEDGYLFLVDRDADVVKSGGRKVSTLEVEAALYEHPAVVEAAAVGVAHRVLGHAVAAAVVARAPVTGRELREFLSGRLAPHQVPGRVVLVDALPHNASGKVVKREVRDMLADRPDGPVAPPRTPTEIALARLWARVLEVPEVGADDDFFALGGQSLAATQLATLATEAFGVEVGVSLLFEAPVLAEQAARIATARRAARIPDGPVGRPLGSTQEYFLRWIREVPGRRIQPVSVALRVRDELDVAVLEQSLNDLVQRHEMLRAVFTEDGYEIRPAAPVRVSTVDAEGYAQAVELACQEVERPFDLATGPLLRALVIRLGVDDAILVLAVEHLVFDGASCGVLLRELGLQYSARRLGRSSPLRPLALTTTQLFATEQARWTANDGFWHRRLAGAPRAVPHLPGHDPTATRYRGRTYAFEIPAAEADWLRDVARAHGATTFMAALAAWCAVLRDWSGASDLVIQTPVTGRTRPEHGSLVGCVVQLLMIRVPVATDFADLLRLVRARCVEAVDHQAHRFADVAARVPYPVHFFFESWGGPAHLPGLDSEPVPLPPELCLDWPFADGDPDLSVPRLSLVEAPDGTVAGRLLYNADAYRAGTVEELAARLRAFISERR